MKFLIFSVTMFLFISAHAFISIKKSECNAKSAPWDCVPTTHTIVEKKDFDEVDVRLTTSNQDILKKLNSEVARLEDALLKNSNETAAALLGDETTKAYLRQIIQEELKKILAEKK